jgi:hypothetical protein
MARHFNHTDALTLDGATPSAVAAPLMVRSEWARNTHGPGSTMDDLDRAILPPELTAVRDLAEDL